MSGAVALTGAGYVAEEDLSAAAVRRRVFPVLGDRGYGWDLLDD